MKISFIDRCRSHWLLLLVMVGCSSGSDSSSQTTESRTKTVTSTNGGSLQLEVAPSPLPVFDNVAVELGVDAAYFTDTVEGRYFLPEIMGGGATWLDFDSDGVLDLYLVNGATLDSQNPSTQRGNWLYRGQMGRRFTLVDESIGAADRGYGQGSASGDFNADGFPDIYVGNFGRNSLYINQGDGTFQQDRVAPVLADDSWTSSVVWVDLNQDDLLDLYVTNYLKMSLDDRKMCEYEGRPGYCGPGQYEAAPDHVFLNLGNGEFKEASEALGFHDSSGKGLAVVVADLDDDLLADIYVANDMTPNFLYTRQSSDNGAPITYHNVADTAGAARSGEGMNEASMGISCEDFDGDSLPDIFLSHYFNMQNTLYLNRGGLQFEDASRRMGTAHTGYPFLGFGTVSLDFNGDGFNDLFVANGHVLGPAIKPNRMSPQLLQNSSGQRMTDVSKTAGEYFTSEWLGRGAATADYDNDGDFDIVVTHLDERAALLRNSTLTGKSFIGLKLSTATRITPVGAKVAVSNSSSTQVRTVKSGGSYLSSSDERLLFHIDAETETVAIQIDWPSGARQEIPSLAINRYWHIAEGKTPW